MGDKILFNRKYLSVIFINNINFLIFKQEDFFINIFWIGQKKDLWFN